MRNRPMVVIDVQRVGVGDRTATGETSAINRRELLHSLGVGVLFTVASRRASASTESKVSSEHEKPRPALSTRLHIAEDGTITLLTGKVECGQGIRTTLTQVAAEELRVPPSRIRLLMGDTGLVPDDGGTWGSLTTPQTVPVVRRACATMRELLIRFAADQSKVDFTSLKVADGYVSTPGGKAFSYLDLAGAGQLSAATDPAAPVTDPADWTVCGAPLPPVHAVALVTGTYRYSSDLKKPGMLHGKIVRPPNQNRRLVSFDASGLEHKSDMKVIHDGNLLGVVAVDPHVAASAVNSIRAVWTDAPLGDPRTLFESLKETAQPPELREFGRYPSLLQKGSLDEGMGSAHHKIKANYQLDYIAHVPLETRAAIAEWSNGELTVHCGTQAPFSVRQEIAEAFQIPEGRIRVIVSDTGSGYGAKHNAECELEAARIAKHSDRPVRLSWTREEEFTQSYCRPAGVMEVSSGVRKNGKIVAWEFHNYNAGAASLTPPYVIPNYYIAYHAARSPLRQGSYRSLAAVANNFARETHIEEMAASIEMDPLEFRLRNIENVRLRTVIERAADRFGWGRSRSGNGTGCGMSCNLEKDGHLALFVELDAEESKVHLKRMVAAFDAGAIINPDILRNQVEGALIQGIGGALFEQLRFDHVRITNPSLSGYRVPRFSDVPEIEVLLIDRRDVASAGAGESPITVAAPAIGAALFAACGKRIRSLPMLPALSV
jgi:CO/xanthine dehydrogenase Mo-binding subunit